MTTFTKTQQLYQFLFPALIPQDEGMMNEAILEFYQNAGFSVLTIEDIYLTIAFYEYAPIDTQADLRKRLYRQLIGYGFVAEAKMKSTSDEDQEAEIVANYQRQGVAVTSFSQLVTYFPCSQVFTEQAAASGLDAEIAEHKLF